jgi:hypothetical protein
MIVKKGFGNVAPRPPKESDVLGWGFDVLCIQSAEHSEMSLKRAAKEQTAGATAMCLGHPRLGLCPRTRPVDLRTSPDTATLVVALQRHVSGNGAAAANDYTFSTSQDY